MTLTDYDVCIECGNPSEVLLGDGKGNHGCLCQDCHSEAMAEVLNSVTVDDKLFGHIRSGDEHGECAIYFDGKPCSWETLGKYVLTYEGWNIKIEFDSAGDEFA